MIALDTNVVSELMRAEPDPRVLKWFYDQPEQQIFLTAVTVAENSYGIARLPGGKRKRTLALTAGTLFADFLDFTLSFDAESAGHHGPLVARRERAGRPIDTEDAQIAAICKLHEVSLATRNTADFEQTGVAVVNSRKA